VSVVTTRYCLRVRMLAYLLPAGGLLVAEFGHLPHPLGPARCACPPRVLPAGLGVSAAAVEP
jgi:hypothetical protein